MLLVVAPVAVGLTAWMFQSGQQNEVVALYRQNGRTTPGFRELTDVLWRVDTFNDLPTEHFRKFIFQFCASGIPTEELPQEVSTKMHGIPQEVAAAVMQKLPQQVYRTDMNAYRDGVYDAHGKSTYYTVKWAMNRKSGVDACFGVVGIQFTAASVITGYETTHVWRQVGTEPCNCGRFWCETCPIMKEVEEKTPLFKQNALTLAQQEGLSASMQRQLEEMTQDAYLPNDEPQWKTHVREIGDELLRRLHMLVVPHGEDGGARRLQDR